MPPIVVALLAAGCQALVVLLALLVASPSFAGRELTAACLCLPPFAAIQYLLRTPNHVLSSVSVLRAFAAAGSGLLIALAGMTLSAGFRLSELRAQLDAATAPRFIVRYEDRWGRTNEADVPREPGETAEQHRERALDLVHAFQVAFPPRDG